VALLCDTFIQLNLQYIFVVIKNSCYSATASSVLQLHGCTSVKHNLWRPKVSTCDCHCASLRPHKLTSLSRTEHACKRKWWLVSLWQDPTLSNPDLQQNWMAAYPGCTLQMKTLFPSWPIMVRDTHTRWRRRLHCRRCCCTKSKLLLTTLDKQKVAFPPPSDIDRTTL